MNQLKFRLTGVAPLLMHKDTLANPLHPLTKAHKALTSKRKKTDEDHELIARSEWRASLYHDAKCGPYVPGVAIQSMLVESAKIKKLGKDFKRGLMVVETMCPLTYDGPRDVEALIADTNFMDIRSVRVQMAKLMRCRPVFRDWSLETTVAFNTEVLNEDHVIQTMQDAGAMVGLLDHRPTFGRFDVERV